MTQKLKEWIDPAEMRAPWFFTSAILTALILILIFCVTARGADSGSVALQVRDLETGQPANLKLIDTGGGSKSPQVHLDSALDLTGSTVTLNLTNVTGVPGATPSPTPAQALSIQGYLTGIPVPIVEKKLASTTKLGVNYSASHITTNTTTTPTSSTAYISAIVVTCTAAGTTETIVIRNKEGTPKVIYQSPTLTAGTITFSFAEPIIATSGIDIVTAGSAAATVDVFCTYWQ